MFQMHFLVLLGLCAFGAQNTYSQSIGAGCGNNIIGNGLAVNNGIGNGLAINNGFGNGLGVNSIGNIGLAGANTGSSAIGYGDVAIAGELPVGGSTAITGNVPVIGYVTFEGTVPAGGMVSVANNCACNK